MMRKIAFFVEGQTELFFIRKLLEEIAGELQISFTIERWRSKKFLSLETGFDSEMPFSVLIVDCGSDGAVKSAILDRRSSLIRSGYSHVVGVRDLYPLAIAELPKLEKALSFRLPTRDIKIDFVIAIMEVEAWFAQERMHYSAIDQLLSVQSIVAATGFNPDTMPAESLPHPAQKLDQIYRIAGKRYNKRKSNAMRTVDALSYENLYINLRARLSSLNRLIEIIEEALFKAAVLSAAAIE